MNDYKLIEVINMEDNKEKNEIWYKYPNLLNKRECENLINDVYANTGLVNSQRTGEDYTGLLEIERYLIEEFDITSKDISPPWNTNIYNGRIFRINNEDKGLICEVQVVLLAEVGDPSDYQVMFSAKVWVDYPDINIYQYKDLCSEIKGKIKLLGLRRFTKGGKPCAEPTMFETYDNVSLDMFKLFMESVQGFANELQTKYPANLPGLMFW